MPYQDRFF
jgi:glutathione S-transferase